MENKTILKQYNTNNTNLGFNDEFMGKPSDADFELIKPFVSKDTTPDDLFVYKLILCDNEIDRDFEQFNHSCISDIASLFYGKVGVYNHNWKSEDIHSRIYKAFPVMVSDSVNSVGEPYEYVEAYAYTIKENTGLINEIKKGLKREVSIGIKGATSICSVCGESHCEHIRGKVYNNKLCYGIIPHAEDAFEFSFVAVNAQREAGVKKNYKLLKGGFKMQEIKEAILKMANNSPSDADILLKAFEELTGSEDEKLQALRSENEELKAKLKEFEDEKAERERATYLAEVMGDLHYTNNKAEELGGEIIAKNEGMLAEDLHNMLITDYGFLFDNVPNEVVDEVVDEVVETVETVEETETETEAETEAETETEEVEEVEEVEKADEVEEVKEEKEETEETEVLKELVQTKLKAFKAAKLNIEAIQDKSVTTKTRKTQSGLKFN